MKQDVPPLNPQFKLSYTYDDISLVPKIRSEIRSRSIPSIKSLGLEIPIIASPMDTVCNSKMALALNELGTMGIIHRFQSIENQCLNLREFLDHAPFGNSNVGVAVGISGDCKLRLNALIREFYDKKLVEIVNGHSGCRWSLWINIDTANGFHSMVEDIVTYAKALIKECPTGVYNNIFLKIIAGNVASGEGYEYLANLGVDAVRVGISNGSPCTTGEVAGVGQGIVSTILECVKVRDEMYGHLSIRRDIPKIIADGGVRTSGDVAKALSLGADAVMCGSLFAGFDESPGEIFEYDSKKCKAYRGMASHAAAVISNEINGTNKQIIPEGIEYHVPYKGSVKDFLQMFVGGVRSAMSYFNATNIKEFRENVNFCLLTYSSHIERTPFIKNAG